MTDTFCIYCQRGFVSPPALRKHIERKHPGTYADENVNVGYTRAEVIATLEGNMDEPPNESEAAVPSTDGAAMKGKFKTMDHQVMECIEVMVDAWHKGVMNDDQALRSIRAYLKARSTVPWTTPLSEAEHQEMLRLYGIDTEASDE